MFKRVEKRRKREEDEELDVKRTSGLSNADSDESDSGVEHELGALSEDSDTDVGEDRDQEGAAASGDGVHEGPPISVADALKDPLYLISFDPTVHGCVLCKGKLIKNTGMAAVHKNANAHKRRFERFRQLSADVDPRSDAWELVKAVRLASNGQRAGSQEVSKRALKRQVKQAAIRGRRERHKELKAKAVAKKASKKLSAVEKTRPGTAPSTSESPSSPELQSNPGEPRKKKRLVTEIPTSVTTKTRNVTAKIALRIKTSGYDKKLVPRSTLKSTRKASKPS